MPELRTIYFDSCVYGHLATGRIPSADRAALRAAVAARRLRIPFSMAAMDELSRLCASDPVAGSTAVQISKEICVRQGVRYHADILTEEAAAVLCGTRRRSIFMGSGNLQEQEFLSSWDSLAQDPSSVRQSLVTFSAWERASNERFTQSMKHAKVELRRLNPRHRPGEGPSMAEFRATEFRGGRVAEARVLPAIVRAGL